MRKGKEGERGGSICGLETGRRPLYHTVPGRVLYVKAIGALQCP